MSARNPPKYYAPIGLVGVAKTQPNEQAPHMDYPNREMKTIYQPFN